MSLQTEVCHCGKGQTVRTVGVQELMLGEVKPKSQGWYVCHSHTIYSCAAPLRYM